MALAQSKVGSQGRISVPAEIRKRLGIVPGSILEWDQEGDKIVVRKKGKYTFDEVHKILFPTGPPKRVSREQMKEHIRESMRKKHPRLR